MDEERVAVVRSAGSQGSGFVLGPRLVLTADHVVTDPGQVSVQLPGRAGRVSCRRVWGRFEDGPRGVWDAALLLADEDLMPGRRVVPVRWGRLVTVQPCPAQAMGYPLHNRTADQALSVLRRTGSVDPVSRADRDRYLLEGPAGPQPVGAGSPWQGMSGAALWCGSEPETAPLLTGVVVQDPPGWSHTRLEAVPAYVLAGDPAFRDLVAQHTGQAMTLEPADLQHLADTLTSTRPPRSPTDLLRPEHHVVAFHGREHLLEELVGWCRHPLPEDPDSGAGPDNRWQEDGDPVRARLLTGPGGAGKTRLSMELASRLASHGWVTVRLTGDTGVSLRVLSRVRRPLLVVVDYAETRVAQLHALLEAVDRAEATAPVRILALARAAGDWWTRAAEDPRGHLLSTAPVEQIPPLHAGVADRAAAYRTAAHHFAAPLSRLHGYRQVDWAGRLSALTAPAAVPPLAGAAYDSALSVQMAALVALLDTTDGAPSGRQEAATLEGRMLGHERRYWDDTAAQRGLTGERTGPQARALAVALAALVPADDRDQARGLLAALPGLGGEDAAGIRGELATWLHDLYPPAGGSYWGSVQPDRIAEHHIGTHLHPDQEATLFTRFLTTLDHDQALHALTVLSRTADHLQHRDATTALLRDALSAAPRVLGAAAVTAATQSRKPAPLIDALTTLADGADDVDLLVELHDCLPLASLALADLAAMVTGKLAERLDSPADRARLALALNNQSVRLSGLGRREEALHAVDRAVEICEVLAEAQPDAFLPDLADALNNQSLRLTALGRREEALEAINRSVEVYQGLAEGRPDAFLLDLARGLNNQAIGLSDVGRREEALESVNRAIKAYQVLAEAQPDAFLPDLALALNNQSVRLSELGRREEALSAVDRAVEICEDLAGAQPDAFLPNLAMALNNQSNRLADLGRREEALHAVDRAVEIREDLARAQPDAFLPDLAMSLYNQANCLSHLGRHEEALKAANRSVDTYQALAQARPDAFLPDLANALTSQSNRLADLGRHEESLEAISRSVDTYQALAQAWPDAFLPGLAMARYNQANGLGALGRYEEALEAANRSVHIYEALAQARPDAFLPDLALALNNQSNWLAALGRHEESLELINRSVHAHQVLARAEPGVFLPNLAGVLTNQAVRLAESGRRVEALRAIGRAVDILTVLAAQVPSVFGEQLHQSLQVQAAVRQL